MDEQQLERAFQPPEKPPIAENPKLLQDAAPDIGDVGDVNGAMPRMVAEAAFRRQPQGLAGDDEAPYGAGAGVGLVEPQAAPWNFLAADSRWHLLIPGFLGTDAFP